MAVARQNTCVNESKWNSEATGSRNKEGGEPQKGKAESEKKIHVPTAIYFHGSLHFFIYLFVFLSLFLVFFPLWMTYLLTLFGLNCKTS